MPAGTLFQELGIPQSHMVDPGLYLEGSLPVSKRINLKGGVRYDAVFTSSDPRGTFTFNGRATGAANNAANAVADFLLGYCSTCTGTFGGARSTYKSPTLAPFLDDVWSVSNALTLQLGMRWEYLAPWHEVNDIEGSFDPVTGKIAYHKVPADLPASLLPLWEDDGQHRIGGLRKAAEADKRFLDYPLPTVIMEGSSRLEEATLFYVINTTSVKVPSISTLYGSGV